MLEQLNNKRKKATRLSLIVTIVIIALTILIVSLSLKHFIFAILGGLFLIIALYILSKFVIIPKYDLIKADLISYSFKTNKNVKCERIKSFVSPINVFFDLVDMSYTNPYRFKKYNLVYDVEDFVITKKERKKVATRKYHGKIIKIEINNYFSKDILAIMDNNQDTNNFVNIAKEHLSNATLSSYMTPNGKYITNTNNKEDLRKIGLLFNNIDNFNMILYKNNVLSIMIKQKEQPFEFNLQNEIDLNTIDLAKKCYSDVDKIISATKGEFKDE